jgi:hypothetical protein
MGRLPFMSKNTVISAMTLALILLAALSVVGCSGDKETKQNSVELINNAYERKVIDYDMRALYLTYSIFKPEALPREYRSDVPMKDATPIILEIQRNWDKLSLETQEKISQYIQPPGEREST